MTMHIEIVEVAPMRVACIRTQTPMAGISQAMGTLFHQVMERASARGLTMAGPPYSRYYSHDPQAVDFEAGMPITGEAESDDALCICTLGGGPAATALHRGPYDRLGETYEAMMAWLQAQGRAPTGPMWEIYLSDPDQVPDPADYETRIYIPVRAAADGG
jgi:AraC family transcriptional regulator